MADAFLTDDDLHRLTGARQASRQARWLRERGIRYSRPADDGGIVSVTWTQVNAYLEGRRRTGPNMEAVHG